VLRITLLQVNEPVAIMGEHILTLQVGMSIRRVIIGVTVSLLMHDGKCSKQHGCSSQF
jgi:hypothetical protein